MLFFSFFITIFAFQNQMRMNPKELLQLINLSKKDDLQQYFYQKEQGNLSLKGLSGSSLALSAASLFDNIPEHQLLSFPIEKLRLFFTMILNCC
jgi:hypothetical protein